MKIISIIFKTIFIYLFISNYVFGQNARIVDLKVRIISPLKNSYIKSPGSVVIQFSVINKGPDDLKTTDTIFYYPQSNDTLFKSKRVYPSKTIQPGDSEIFTCLIPFNSPYDQNYYFLGIMALSAYNRSKDYLTNEPLSTQGDNTATTSVKHRSATSGINYTSNLKEPFFYPNPVNDFLFFNFDKNSFDYSILITDSKGIIVKDYDLSNNLRYPFIKTDDLPNGLYFIKFSNNNYTVCSKLIVLH